MIRFEMSWLLLIVFALPTSLVIGQEYYLDSVQTSVIFAVKHFDIGYTYGRFNKVEGDIFVDEIIPENSRFQFKIDVKSIDTNDEGRDLHLKGPEMFDTEQHPFIEFVSKSVKLEKSKKGAKTYFAKGNLTMHGEEKPLTIPLQVTGKGKDKFGKQRIGFISKFSVSRSLFGMNKLAPGVGDKVAITFSTEAIMKDK